MPCPWEFSRGVQSQGGGQEIGEEEKQGLCRLIGMDRVDRRYPNKERGHEEGQCGAEQGCGPPPDEVAHPGEDRDENDHGLPGGAPSPEAPRQAEEEPG